MNKGWDMKKDTSYYMPFRRQETFEPILLELPLPQPEYYEQMQKPKEKEVESGRGVWTIDI